MSTAAVLDASLDHYILMHWICDMHGWKRQGTAEGRLGLQRYDRNKFKEVHDAWPTSPAHGTH